MNKIDALEVFLHGRRVGRLAMTPERLCAFQYDAEYLRDGVSVSPFHLPLKGDLFIADRLPFDGCFGVFDDSLPDGWGRFVMDRYLRAEGMDPDRLSPTELLSLIGNTGRGALEYRPASLDATEESRAFSFGAFEKAATDILLSAEHPGASIGAKGGNQTLNTLFEYSGSAGGARPKAFVKIDGREWLVKFRAADDPPGVGRIEYEYSLLAKRCGIKMPETRLFEDKYFGTERFDRTPAGKVHVISAAALLNANYRAPSLDYLALLNACRVLTRDMREVEALFRVMAFNVIIQNRDDHAKNFAFLLSGSRWRLAPAYDLLPSRGFGGYHTTTVNGKGDPNAADVIAVAGAAGLNREIAASIYETIAMEHKNFE
jgi:serine/threonine-protein kinase HipA